MHELARGKKRDMLIESVEAEDPTMSAGKVTSIFPKSRLSDSFFPIHLEPELRELLYPHGDDDEESLSEYLT